MLDSLFFLIIINEMTFVKKKRKKQQIMIFYFSVTRVVLVSVHKLYQSLKMNSV